MLCFHDQIDPPLPYCELQMIKSSRPLAKEFSKSNTSPSSHISSKMTIWFTIYSGLLHLQTVDVKLCSLHKNSTCITTKRLSSPGEDTVLTYGTHLEPSRYHQWHGSFLTPFLPQRESSIALTRRYTEKCQICPVHTCLSWQPSPYHLSKRGPPRLLLIRRKSVSTADYKDGPTEYAKF